jgi:exopolyphosphatase/guanosine-5'-triphosphate,3'-diphosphate pyrophosphatase
MARKRASSSESFGDVLGAIDVGTNAVRLELVRVQPDGSLESLHQERDPVRPGEGLFQTGVIKREVADRLLSTLRRYAALSQRFGAKVRAVATSAVREAKNRDEIVRRARVEAGLTLEVVSGKEEARLICMGVLHGKPPLARSLCVDIGGGSTEIAFAYGEHPKDLWSLSLGAVRLTELFGPIGKLDRKELKLMRRYVGEVLRKSLPERIPHAPRTALGSSGTIGAVVAFAAAEGTGHATARQISRAVEELAEMSPEKRRKRFDSRRADIVVAGAVILEAVASRLNLDAVIAVSSGLREGVLYDLLRRRTTDYDDHSLADAAVAFGRRFGFDEVHGRQVARIALTLFDDLASLHMLPAAARPLLEMAALLHDVGNAVNYQKHHRHTYYLIQQADIAGLPDRERELVGRIARYHRRSAPDLDHPGMEGLTPSEARTVRKCATLLRVADSLDASHHQPVSRLSAGVKGRTVAVRLKVRAPVDLELWDAGHEEALFRQVFGHKLVLHVERAR